MQLKLNHFLFIFNAKYYIINIISSTKYICKYFSYFSRWFFYQIFLYLRYICYCFYVPCPFNSFLHDYFLFLSAILACFLLFQRAYLHVKKNCHIFHWLNCIARKLFWVNGIVLLLVFFYAYLTVFFADRNNLSKLKRLHMDRVIWVPQIETLLLTLKSPNWFKHDDKGHFPLI